MSKVFIAWSGNNEIAKQIKAHIDEKTGYEAIVGGNLYGHDSIYVGGTIIEQMKKCDQAILLIQKNPRINAISPNLMFEWGYLLAKLNIKKIHNYFIDISPNDPALPSDLHGVWAHSIFTDGRTEGEIASELADKFFGSQNNTLTENKMMLIINRDETRKKILSHLVDPICSNYEMAQYILCYIYSSNIYIETRQEALSDMQSFLDRLDDSGFQSAELVLASRLAVTSIKFFLDIKYVTDEQYIKFEKFYKHREKFEDLFDRIDDLPESELKNWLLAFVYNFLSYLYLLIVNSDEIDDDVMPDDKKADYCYRLYDISEKAANLCNTIEGQAPNVNRQLCTLLRGYMYRDMFCALNCLERIESLEIVPRSEDKESRRKKILNCLELSFKERKKLYDEYSLKNINSTFINNIEMEYFLGLAELQLYESDDVRRKNHKEKLMRYVERADRNISEKKVFTEKIKNYLKK